MTTRLEKMHEQIEKIHTGDGDYINADILHRYIDVQEATAQGHYEEAQDYKKRAAEMQLVAGRYQYQFEQAMKALNAIDDFFEYRYLSLGYDSMQASVREILAVFSDAVNKPNKGGSK